MVAPDDEFWASTEENFISIEALWTLKQRSVTQLSVIFLLPITKITHFLERPSPLMGFEPVASAEATDSNPFEAPKNFFSGYFRNCLNCDSLRWSHTHFM